MTQNFKLTVLLTAFGALMPFAAHASKTVNSAKITQGETYLESKSEYVIDDNDNRDGAWKEKINLAHGFTSYWASELEGTYNHGGSDDRGTEFQTLEWKNKFQFTDQKNSHLDSGIRIGYLLDMTGDNPDELEVKFLAGKDIGNFAHKINVIFDREVGNEADNGLDFGLAWSSRYKYSDAFQPGFEIYDAFGRIGEQGSFDDQDHRIGPVFYGKFKNGLAYDAGYLIGVSNGAPDGTVKAIIRYSW